MAKEGDNYLIQLKFKSWDLRTEALVEEFLAELLTNKDAVARSHMQPSEEFTIQDVQKEEK